MIAPDSNRSATARSITTRTPLWVSEVEFEDGTVGYATDGTPVDCVRFAELGLLGERPELIVSGINHGCNLGDDVTYSGTVAAALEGIVLGIPAIAVSQQSVSGEMDFNLGREFDFSVSAPLDRRARRDRRLRRDAGRNPAQRQLPRRCAEGGRGRRGSASGVYNDELKQVDDDGNGRKRYRIYGYSPGLRGAGGNRPDRGRAPATSRSRPIHFDLTDHSGFDSVRGLRLEDALERVLESVGA